MEITIYDQSGKASGKIKVDKAIFGREVNEELVHQALIRQLANARHATAHTKSRGERRGGGRKPYRQKGTGRARQGSIRSPHYRGGGIVFGPTNDRNYTKDMPKKQRQTALKCAVSAKAANDAVLALEKYEDKDLKTKNFATLISKLPIDRDVLIVADQATKNDILRVSKNIPTVKVVLPGYVNIADLLKYDKVMFTKAAIEEFQSIYAN